MRGTVREDDRTFGTDAVNGWIDLEYRKTKNALEALWQGNWAAVGTLQDKRNIRQEVAVYSDSPRGSNVERIHMAAPPPLIKLRLRRPFWPRSEAPGSEPSPIDTL